MHLGLNLADDTWPEDLPERRNRLAGCAIGAVPAATAALKEAEFTLLSQPTRRTCQ